VAVSAATAARNSVKRRILMVFDQTRSMDERCGNKALVELTSALTLLVSFSAFLLFPIVNAPPVFSRVAIALCAAEFCAVIVWVAGRRCIVAGCPEAAQAARSAAAVDIPALTALMLVLAAVYGVRVARTW
jgi:hypothetical protein